MGYKTHNAPPYCKYWNYAAISPPELGGVVAAPLSILPDPTFWHPSFACGNITDITRVWRKLHRVTFNTRVQLLYRGDAIIRYRMAPPTARDCSDWLIDWLIDCKLSHHTVSCCGIFPIASGLSSHFYPPSPASLPRRDLSLTQQRDYSLSEIIAGMRV